MQVYIVSKDGPPREIAISEKALAQVRASFNPSGSSAVDRVKVLCAALITEAEHAGTAEHAGAEEGRCAALARTHIETGSMFAVKALTTPAALEAAAKPQPLGGASIDPSTTAAPAAAGGDAGDAQVQDATSAPASEPAPA